MTMVRSLRVRGNASNSISAFLRYETDRRRVRLRGLMGASACAVLMFYSLHAAAAGTALTIDGSVNNDTFSSPSGGYTGSTLTLGPAITLENFLTAPNYSPPPTNMGSGGVIAAVNSIIIQKAGSLSLANPQGASPAVTSGATVTFGSGGGTLSLANGGGLSQTFGTLTLSSSSIIDFGSLNLPANQTISLTFANSSSIGWGGTLSIYNWNPSVDDLFFGSSGSGLSSTQLSDIEFYYDDGTELIGSAGIESDGELYAIPEPSAVFVGLGLLGLVVWRERKRFLRSVRASETESATGTT